VDAPPLSDVEQRGRLRLIQCPHFLGLGFGGINGVGRISPPRASTRRSERA
jgi:hypothetical protein